MMERLERMAIDPATANLPLDARLEAIRNTRIEAMEKMLQSHRKIMMVCITLLVAIGVWNGQSVIRTGSVLDETSSRIGRIETAKASVTPIGTEPADVLKARGIELLNDSGDVVMRLSAASGSGKLALMSPNGETVVEISTGENGDGQFLARDNLGREMARIAAGSSGGTVQVTSGAGKQRAQLIANQEGAMAAVYNNQGQPICTMNPDEEGNGIVGAWSRSDGGQALRGADSKPGDGESSNN